MIQRSIDRNEIEEAVMCGEVIENYPDDKYSPSCLVFGKTKRGKNTTYSIIFTTFSC